MSQYTVFVVSEEFKAMKKLPGSIRQRIRRAIDELANDPRPPGSKQLEVGAAALDCEVRRLRIDSWRIVYLVTEAEKVIDIAAIRKRPPYDYGDLAELISNEP